MISYHHTAGEEQPPRPHPWSTALTDSSQAYVDFKTNPTLIRTALEDWVLYKSEPFAESFFQLLEWLNGSDSHLESNDCAFRAAHPNTTDKQFKFPERCDGRLMILYRDLYLNTQTATVDWLFNETFSALEGVDQEFTAGAVGLSFLKAVYLALGDGKKKGALGFQIGFSFFAYGADRAASHANIDRLLRNVRAALEIVNARIAKGEPQGLLRS